MDKVIYNPIFKDTVTFIKTSRETRGQISEMEVILGPGGGNPIHKHTAFTETFTVLDGQLRLHLDGKELILNKGESVIVMVGQAHRFYNTSEAPALFNLKFIPGHTGAENMLRIMYGLARDGKTNKSGIPKNVNALVVAGDLGDSNLVGIPGLFISVMKFLTTITRGKTETKLVEKYCS
jgi:quercetin dioxygenase-like cupin family protein